MTVGFSPVSSRDRIEAMDVIRGFALLGIALMNVEFFNRPLAALGDGLPTGLEGADAWAALAIHLFVRDKFFTIFSILFGMGFALMLARAQAAGRHFTTPYLRRTVALALFGLMHGMLIWAGDILLSYASAAAVLLAVLLGRGWMMWVAFALLIAVGFAFNLPEDAGFTAFLLLIDALVLTWFRRGAAAGSLALQGRNLMKAGLTLYLLPAVLLALLGGIQWRAEAARAVGPVAQMSTEETRARAEGERRMKEALRQQAQQAAMEASVMTRGSYADAVKFRAPHFIADFTRAIFFVPMAMGLFMIGAWLLRSGAVNEPLQHLGLLRAWAWIALPAGLLTTVASAMIATDPGSGQARWMTAGGLQLIGSLPMALGYVALLLLALQRQSWRRGLGWLAPAGRMALTNYIGQSVLCSLFFFGYGLGFWGMPRAQQVLFVLGMFVLQVLLSRWWLARFRFGPLEWLWRWMTYGARPAMRVEVQAAIAGP